MRARRIVPDMTRHAGVLFGAISALLASLGCTKKEQPPSHTTIEVPAVGVPVEAELPEVLEEPAPKASAEAWEPAPRSSVEAWAAAASAVPAASSTWPTRPPHAAPSSTGWVVEGRPFLIDGAPRLAPARAAATSAWSDVLVALPAVATQAERVALVEHYTKWALAEHASIASFARFALQLMALGAPSWLVTRALAAAADEVRHARVGFGLVAALGGGAMEPAELPVEGALAEVTLAQALRLAVREGVIGETIAALELRAAADLAVPGLAEALTSIADDESRHAELAYAFVAWALARAPELAEVVVEEIDRWRLGDLPGHPHLERWGILDVASRRGVHAQGFALVVRPLVEQLVAGSWA
jgi:hypothetical protein